MTLPPKKAPKQREAQRIRGMIENLDLLILAAEQGVKPSYLIEVAAKNLASQLNIKFSNVSQVRSDSISHMFELWKQGLFEHDLHKGRKKLPNF